MPDSATTRDFIARHVGGEWHSVCISPEEDREGAPVTIVYTVQDCHATHFESAPLPLATAKSLHMLLDKNYRQIIQLAPQPNDPETAVLRMNVKKATALMANQNFCTDTAQTPLCELSAAKAPSQARAKS
jgi:hypothetical protein